MATVALCQVCSLEESAAQVAAPVVVAESECKVKYVYLYSFGMFTKWPDATFKRTNNTFVIGVLGDKPFGHYLDEIAKRRKIENRKIVVRRFKSMADYRPCQILYVTETITKKDAKLAAAKLKGDSVLIVGEKAGFEFDGGAIVFRIEGDSVKFNLNVDAVERRRLMVSARLSRVASLVRDKGR